MAKITANEFVKVAWVPDAYMTVAQASNPTDVILNAATTVKLSPAIAWQDFTLGASDSDDVEDRGITDPGNAVSRGFANFEATISYFRDSNLADGGSDYNKAFNTFRTPRTYGYLVLRVAESKWDLPWTVGDRVSVFKVIADIIVDDTEGDDSVKFTVSYLPQGLMYPYTIVRGTTASAITGVPATGTLAVNANRVLLPVLSGKDIRAVATYTSSDSSKVTVSSNGVVVGIAAGTSNVTVSHPSALAPVVQAITVA